jgi:hypothetical protein
MPTLTIAQRDQIDAAVADARTRLLRAADACHGEQLISTDRWLNTQVHRFLSDIHARRTRLCEHIDGSPRVVHAALWAPRLLVCQDCIPLLAPTAIEDATCDRCRQVVPAIAAHLANVGSILLAFGLCRTCSDLTTPAISASTHTNRKDPK